MSTDRPASGLVLDDFLPFRLSVASNLVSDVIASSYQALFGLKIPEWRVVAVTAESDGGLSQQAIGVRTRMDKVTVSRAVRALEQRGLLERSADEADGRALRVALSQSGWRLYESVAPQALALEARLFDRLDQEERAQLESLLSRVMQAALALKG
jgi:DNA-binding MarR family transcriptional regulator